MSERVRKKPTQEQIKQRNDKMQAQMSHIGPLTTKQFKTMQEYLANYDEASRYAACYNLLSIMNDMEDDEDNVLQPLP